MVRQGSGARQLVDVRHGEVEFGLLGGCQQVQDRVGRAAHGDVEGHGVLEGGTAADVARQDRLVVLLVVACGQLDDRTARVLVERLAGGVRGEHRAVAGEGEADGLGEAVHRVGGEHAGAGAAGGAGALLDPEHVLVGDVFVDGVGDGVDQVELADGAV